MLTELIEKAHRYIESRERFNNYSEADSMRELVANAWTSGDWRKVRDRMDPKKNSDIVAT